MCNKVPKDSMVGGKPCLPIRRTHAVQMDTILGVMVAGECMKFATKLLFIGDGNALGG
jgi:hypothetical protein